MENNKDKRINRWIFEVDTIAGKHFIEAEAGTELEPNHDPLHLDKEKSKGCWRIYFYDNTTLDLVVKRKQEAYWDYLWCTDKEPLECSVVQIVANIVFTVLEDTDHEYFDFSLADGIYTMDLVYSSSDYSASFGDES